MDSVVESLLTTLNVLQRKKSEINESSRDLLRLCTRCEIFSSILEELKSHPMMLSDLSEAENELLYDLHTTIQNICTFIDDNVNHADYKAVTQLEFRLSYFTDLAQLNQKITQLIEALNLLEEVDLDRTRDEDLEDAKESFEYIVRRVIFEISKPTNVYFEEEFDSLNQDIDNHEEALSKLLALLKHRPLSVAEAKILRAEINRLKMVVEESRSEMRQKNVIGNANDYFPFQNNTNYSNIVATPARNSGASSLSGPSVYPASEKSSLYSNRRLPELPLSSSTTPHTSAKSKSSMSSAESNAFNSLPSQRGLPVQHPLTSPYSVPNSSPFPNSNNGGYSHSSTYSKSSPFSHSQQMLIQTSSALVPMPATNANYNYPANQNRALVVAESTPAYSSSSARSSYSSAPVTELTAPLLHRILAAPEQLSVEDEALKTRLLESMTLVSNDLEVTKIRVGRGAFGDVCLGTLRHRYKVAIKTLKRSDDLRKDEQRRRIIEKEMLISKYLGSYPTIPVCYGFLTLDKVIQVVQELAPFGSLALILKDCTSFPIVPAALKIAWLSDLADAMRFLHSKEIMHKNICVDNVLVFEKLRLKLGDFGPEKSKGRSEGDIKAFLAPEVREGRNPEYGSDVYSFAMTAIQIFSRRVPSLEKPDEQVISAIDKEWIEPIESKESLVSLFLHSLKTDDNQHVNDVRPSSDDLFQEILTILETVGGDPREETHCIDHSVILEMESVAKQKRNEAMRTRSSYKSNLSLKPSSMNSPHGQSRRSSINLTGSSWLMRNSFRQSMNGSSFSQFQRSVGGNQSSSSSSSSAYGLYQDAASINQQPEVGFLTNSIDIEDKASIAYFLIQAGKFTPLEADFLADRLVRKGVSCVSTLRRKLHRDDQYLASIGIDRDTAKRIQTAIFAIKSPSASAIACGGSEVNHSSSSAAIPVKKPSNIRRKDSAQSMYRNRQSLRRTTPSNTDAEGHTDRDNESDSLGSNSDYLGSSSGGKRKMRYAATQKEIALEKAMTAAADDEDEEKFEEDEGEVQLSRNYLDLDLSPEESIEKLYQNSKQLMERRTILSKFLRVEINLSPDLANKYSDLLIAHDILDLASLQKKMMSDSKVLVKFGFDKKISNSIFDHLTVQAITRFQDEQRVNDVDMSLNPSAATVSVPRISPDPFTAPSSQQIRSYVTENCAVDLPPHDIANLYYEASQLNNADALERLLEVAESGDYLAQGFLMRMYALGQGEVKQDLTVAQEMGRKLFPWLQHAIQTENSSQIVMYARYLTGVCYSLGLGVTKNEAEAIKWYTQSAHQGYIGAQAYLGYCYYLGVGVEKDLLEAFNWYKISALRGHSASQCNLGLCYEYGHGCEKNLLEAVRWYRASAEQGDVIAQFSIGNLYEKGRKGLDQNFGESFKYYKMSAERGYDAAQYALGCCYYGGLGVEQSLDQAFYWFSLAATANNPAAQTKVGFCYENGIGTEKNIHRAIEYYQLAARQQHPAALYYLGYCYFTGAGVEANINEAVRLYMISASKRYAAAQNNLGFCYFNGIGVDKDLTKAIEWYTLAANQEYPAAQYNLGYCYEKGYGVQPDQRESLKWYQKAAKNGHGRARKSLQRMNLGVSPY